MDLTTRLTEEMEPHVLFSIPMGHWKIEITDTIFVMWIIMAVIILLTVIFTRRLKLVPEGKQKVTEIVVEFINNLSKDAIGHHWRYFAPYLGTVFLFLVLANTASVFNVIPTAKDLYQLTHLEFFEKIPEFSIRPPTKDVNTTASLAIMSIVLVLFAGVRFKRVKGWLKSFIEPVPFLLPFKILEYGIKPLSLCFRLFGNILAAFIIMEFLMFVVPVVIPPFASIYFDLFDGILQAYVFVFLTSLYIQEAVE